MKASSVKTLLISVMVMGVMNLTGCSSTPMTQVEKENLYEEADYTNWKGSEEKQERIQARLNGEIMSNLATEYDKEGLIAFQQRLKKSGIQAHSLVYFGSSVITNWSPTNVIGSLLGATSNGPSFGSVEYETQIIRNINLNSMALNSAALTQNITVNPELLDNNGLSPDHKVHIYAKARLLAQREYYESLTAMGFTCLHIQLDEKTHNYAGARVFIRPLDTYEDSMTCKQDADTLFIVSQVFPIKEDNGTYTIRGTIRTVMAKASPMPSTELFSSLNAYFDKSNLWDTLFTTARDLPDLDRKVVIKSKHQNEPWVEQYAKHSIYR
jgi:hypothetical protein